MATKRDHTSLNKHKRVRNRLVPPLQQMAETGKLQFSSWVDNRLPDLLWLAIIRTSLPQEQALNIFRTISVRSRLADPKGSPILTHTILATLSADDFDKVMEPALTNPQIKSRLGAMLELVQLPDRHHWIRHLVSTENALSILAQAVSSCMDHQSQESTDMRWFSVMCMVVADKVRLPEGDRLREMAREWQEYPNYGDQRKVRPSIRSFEMMIRQNPDGTVSDWCARFWQECWTRTDCIPGDRTIAARKEADWEIDLSPFAERLTTIYEELLKHARETRTNTHIDPRHDASFGLAFYTLYMTYESVVTGAFHRAIGQIIVRVIAETVLTLAYLRKQDQPALWTKYRNYGTGQIKLNFLKMLEQGDAPEFVDMALFERLINEDFWHEHLEIDLGQWAGSDLRKMSTEAGNKDVYDKYYSTTSPFVHAAWSAVRMVSFDTCLNPLHRFHRIPARPNALFPPNFIDLKKLVNVSLDLLASLYPEFKLRIRDEDLPSRSPSAPGDATP